MKKVLLAALAILGWGILTFAKDWESPAPVLVNKSELLNYDGKWYYFSLECDVSRLDENLHTLVSRLLFSEKTPSVEEGYEAFRQKLLAGHIAPKTQDTPQGAKVDSALYTVKVLDNTSENYVTISVNVKNNLQAILPNEKAGRVPKNLDVKFSYDLKKGKVITTQDVFAKRTATHRVTIVADDIKSLWIDKGDIYLCSANKTVQQPIGKFVDYYTENFKKMYGKGRLAYQQNRYKENKAKAIPWKPMSTAASGKGAGRATEQRKSPQDTKIAIGSFDVGGPQSTGEVVTTHGQASAKKLDKQPQFPGGDAALFKYLSANVKYPAVAEENGVQGRVLVEFIVERDGSISEVKVAKGVDPSLDREAVRVVSTMPRWKPGMLNGEAVRVKYTTPVTFRLQ